MGVHFVNGRLLSDELDRSALRADIRAVTMKLRLRRRGVYH